MPNQSNQVLYRSYTKMGILELVPFSLEQHGAWVYDWVKQPYAVYWGMGDSSYEAFQQSYQELLEPDHYHIYIGLIDGEAKFLMEQYDPFQDALATHFQMEIGDVGMHVLMAPVEQKVSGFTWTVFSNILEFIFTSSAHKRVIVEPDVRNKKIHTLNKRAGFKYQERVTLPHKTAWVATCTKEDFKLACDLEKSMKEGRAFQPSQKIWKQVNRHLVLKAISEFSHELILKPSLVYDNLFSLKTNNKPYTYLFEAKKLPLDHWLITPETLIKESDEIEVELNMQDFVLEFKDELGIPDEFLATYLEEINSTLYSLAYKHTFEKHSSAELIYEDFQTIEHTMAEGHPCFVANSGRIGFSSRDFLQYAPEAYNGFSLVWLAGHRSCTSFTSIEGLNYDQLAEQELGVGQIVAFDKVLVSKGLDPMDYIYIPVHPWQWENKINLMFTNDLANNKLIYLGEGDQQYVAQQSIRTLYNTSTPANHYVKTAMSILNMGFVRGLSAHYMKSTPAITNWINELLLKDEILKTYGFDMLGEIATVGYENETYASLGYRHANNKMLAALWRESPQAKLATGEGVMTMAALLHQDQSGDALIKHIIKASGLTTADWIQRYLDAYLVPLTHCLYNYKLVFMPHGENIILRMKDHIPQGIFMKDITEEVIVFDTEAQLPEHVDRLQTAASLEMQALSIHTDVFDCFFRFFAAILEIQCDYTADTFWEQVGDCILSYQVQHPELQTAFDELELLNPRFKRCCLNRLQLSNTKQMLDLSDPINSLKIEGYLENPLPQTLITY